MSKVLASVACVAALSLASAAYAVDIENQDATDHEITISIGDGGPVTFKLKAGEKKTNICGDEACVLMLNNDAWDAGTDEEFTVKNGRLHVQTRG